MFSQWLLLMSLLLLQCRMKVQLDSVMRDQFEGRRRLSFEVEATSQDLVRFEDNLHALLKECSESVVCLRANFKFYGCWCDLPPISLTRPSVTSLEAVLKTMNRDLPRQRHLCKVTIYAVSSQCHGYLYSCRFVVLVSTCGFSCCRPR